MDAENQDASEVLETTETVEQEDAEAAQADDEETVTLSKTEAEELRTRASKADDLEKKNKQLFSRIKKQEEGEKPAPEKPQQLSDTDIFALVKSDVSEDDIPEVKKYAAYKGVSVAEALKDKTLKSILADRAEERRSAEAATTRSTRGSSKVSGDTLLANARKGSVAESDIEKLVEAELDAKRKK